MARIRFTGENNEPYYYICSANYVLTKQGIYASVSGTARSISDYDYVGKTEKQLRGKLAMEYNYGGTVMTQDGIQLVETKETTEVNDDTSVPAIVAQGLKIFGATPLGDGLFRLGNDIVSSYPLVNTEIDLDNHKITYKYQPYDIEVTWTETTPGVRTNPHWRRIRH